MGENALEWFILRKGRRTPLQAKIYIICCIIIGVRMQVHSHQVQAALLVQLIAYTATRPGSILSSEKYTESLLYKVVTTK